MTPEPSTPQPFTPFTPSTQAVAYHRTKKAGDALKYLNNFLACARLAGGDLRGAGKWDSSAELLDLYGDYCAATADGALQAEMAAALELAEGDAAGVRDAVKGGTFRQAAAGAGIAKDRSSGSIF